MGRLDSTIQMLQERRKRAPTPAEYVEKAAPPSVGPTGSPYLDQMVQIMERPKLQAEDLKDGFIALASGLVSLDSQVAELAEALGRKPEAFDPVIAEIGSIKAALKTLVDAIRGIKLPELKVPEYPTPKDVDLSPVLDGLESIRTLVSTPTAGPTEESKVREWKFDIKRGPGGYIKTIEAKEQ